MEKEIIFLDMSGSVTYALPKFEMAIDTLKLIIESSDATKFYVYGVGMHKIALLTRKEYECLTKLNAKFLLKNLHSFIKNVDSYQGTFFTFTLPDYKLIKKVIPKKLFDNTRIRIISDSDLKMHRGSIRKDIEKFFYDNYHNLKNIQFYDIDDSLARLFHKELKSLRVITKTVSAKPKPKKREIEPTITK